MRSQTCCGLGCRGVDRRPLQVDAQVEVGDDPVPQILGGEIVQRCPGHGSSERGDVVSLIIDSLHELRQRWPVALSEESLVELAGQGRPPQLRSDRGRFGQPSLDLADALQGIGGGPTGIEVPLLHMREQGPPNRRQGKVEAGADRAAALISTLRGPGRDDPRRLKLGLIGWQAGEPFVNEFVAERSRLVQQGGERCRAVEG
jgi:hypothetical protein